MPNGQAKMMKCLEYAGQSVLSRLAGTPLNLDISEWIPDYLQWGSLRLVISYYDKFTETSWENWEPHVDNTWIEFQASKRVIAKVLLGRDDIGQESTPEAALDRLLLDVGGVSDAMLNSTRIRSELYESIRMKIFRSQEASMLFD
ncbi:hypothetical protein HKX48_000614 [Thoreauomyces humboldtii]|nr:hypothetical protein HKX48_000614 [Thoreauomyces humboldtii]